MSEPAPGPYPGGHLRASDADREQVSTVLSTAYAEGRITREEHAERLDQVLAARTFDDLVPITADLLPTELPVQRPLPAPVAERSYTVEPTPDASTETVVAVFGGASRSGRWRVKRQTTAVAVFGGVDLDLRQAVFEGDTIEINGLWLFGGMDVKVPEGVEVRDQTVGVFGGTEVKSVGERQPGAPTLVVKGLALFGGVSIAGPKRRGRHRDLHRH